MVFLGLPGEKPMMPPPPKVCPPIPEDEPPKDDVLKEPDELPPEELESVPPVLLPLLLPPGLSVELPGAPGVPLRLDGLDGSLGLADAPDPPGVAPELLESVGQPPIGELVPMPMEVLRPEEPKLDELRLDELRLDELDELRLDELESDAPGPRPFKPQLAPMPPINELAMGLPKKP